MLRRVRSLVLAMGLFAGALAPIGASYAQEAKGVADDRADSFQAVTGAVKEDVAGGPLMLAAYAIAWLAVFGYVFRLVRLQRGVEANLSRLERALGPEHAGSR
jgi:CcmD family protein